MLRKPHTASIILADREADVLYKKHLSQMEGIFHRKKDQKDARTRIETMVSVLRIKHNHHEWATKQKSIFDNKVNWKIYNQIARVKSAYRESYASANPRPVAQTESVYQIKSLRRGLKRREQ
jgi:uncharacterized protein YaaW (UPF0174 family)